VTFHQCLLFAGFKRKVSSKGWVGCREVYGGTVGKVEGLPCLGVV